MSNTKYVYVQCDNFNVNTELINVINSFRQENENIEDILEFKN